MKMPDLKKILVKTKSRQDRINMIDNCDKKLSIVKQAKLLSINRTSLYYQSVPISDEEYRIKRVIDDVYTVHPEYGYRRMTVILNRDYNIFLIAKRSHRYMWKMGCMDSVKD